MSSAIHPANTPDPPYYAVIFTSLRTKGDNGYTDTAQHMLALAREQPGFLGVDSVRDGLGITVSYWTSLEAILAWKDNSEHRAAQGQARKWYECFHVRICRVEREYGFRA